MDHELPKPESSRRTDLRFIGEKTTRTSTLNMYWAMAELIDNEIQPPHSLILSLVPEARKIYTAKGPSPK